MIILLLLLCFSSAFIFIRLILGSVYKNKYVVSLRLEGIAAQNSKSTDDRLSQPFLIRVIKPLLDGISRTVLKITPREMISGFDRKIIMAGKPYNFSVKDWINLQAVIVLCLPVLTIVSGYYLNLDFRRLFFCVLIEVGVGLILPNLIIGKKISDRQRKITNSLPDIIDLLTVSVEAGLGFDGALAKVIEKMPGPLAVEFDNVLQEIKVGKQKKDALRDMADRINVPDLTTFVSSVIQADQFGISIGNVLRIQSAQVRQKRRQRAQEKAMKAPVKMLLPMILFIFPTIFSVLMGPVVIKIIAVFSK